MASESENNEEESDDFDDNEVQEESITFEKGSDDEICKRIVANKQEEPTINKTLGKRKRNSNETKRKK
jgi:hypothetical protein